jgi:hypothetical protein
VSGFQIPGDLRLSSNGLDFDLADGLLRVRQLIETGSTVFQGYWIYDLNAGIPYFQAVMAKGAGLETIRAVFSEFLLSIDGVLSIESLTVDVDTVLRKSVVKYVVRVSDGSELSGDLPYEIATR